MSLWLANIFLDNKLHFLTTCGDASQMVYVLQYWIQDGETSVAYKSELSKWGTAYGLKHSVYAIILLQSISYTKFPKPCTNGINDVSIVLQFNLHLSELSR